MPLHLLTAIGLLAILGLTAACGEANEGSGATAAVDADSSAGPAAKPRTSPGKPGAPIAIDYDIIGVPLVGQPVNIDVAVSSARGEAPVKLSWRVLDGGSLSFPEQQQREVALRVSPRQAETRQVTVVPQREGRLYLNVTAEMETPEGAMLKTVAIPIQVGGPPGTPEPAGEVKEDSGGEAVMSLPADNR